MSKKNNEIAAVIDNLNTYITKNKVINILMAVITFYSFCMQNIFPVYNLGSWIIFFTLIILFTKTDLNQKNKKIILIFSGIYSFLFVFGSIVYKTQDLPTINVFSELFHFEYLLYFAGDYCIIYAILCYLFPFLYKKTNINKKPITEYDERRIFIVSFIILFLSWFLYFISYYPGLLSPDSLVNVDMLMIKDYTLSNHHPIIHSMLMVLLMKFGMKIFGSLVAGVATAILFQMIVMALIFAYTISYSYRLKANKKILIIMLIVYSCVPIFGFYSITMWKDIMFGGFILLLTIETHKLFILNKTKNITFKDLILFLVISLLCLFFRNNAVYMYFIFIIVMLIFYKKYYKPLLISFAIVLGIYYFVEGPVLKYFNVKPTESAEYIGMPLQMVGRMAYKNVEFTKKEKRLINELIPLDVLPSAYNPRSSDGIKQNPKYKMKNFDKNKSQYFKLWLSLVMKHPGIALEAYVNSTLGYWYPSVRYWAANTYSYGNNPYGLGNTAFSKTIKNVTLYLEDRNTPIVNMVWSIGLCVWFIALLFYMAIKKYGYKIITVYTPVLGVWLTLMVASPVFAEFRYIFSAFTCLPFFVVINFLEGKKY